MKYSLKSINPNNDNKIIFSNLLNKPFAKNKQKCFEIHKLI